MERGRLGSILDEFLADEGIIEEATEHAVKSVLAWADRAGDEGAEPHQERHGAADGDQPRAARPAARSGEHVCDAAHVAEGGGGGGEALCGSSWYDARPVAYGIPANGLSR